MTKSIDASLPFPRRFARRAVGTTAGVVQCFLLVLAMLSGAEGNSFDRVLEPCNPRRSLLSCGGGGGGGGGGGSPPAGPLNECRVTFTRRGYSAFTNAKIERFDTAGRYLWSGSASNSGGALGEGESLTVNLQTLSDVDLRQSYFVLKTDGNSERCGGSQKTVVPLLKGERITTGRYPSSSSTCETTFWHTKSFWRCKTKATFRFRVSLECKDDDVWQPRHFRGSPIPNECSGCSNCF